MLRPRPCVQTLRRIAPSGELKEYEPSRNAVYLPLRSTRLENRGALWNAVACALDLSAGARAAKVDETRLLQSDAGEPARARRAEMPQRERHHPRCRNSANLAF